MFGGGRHITNRIKVNGINGERNREQRTKQKTTTTATTNMIIVINKYVKNG
jgi:hypothetical protein